MLQSWRINGLFRYTSRPYVAAMCSSRRWSRSPTSNPNTSSLSPQICSFQWRGKKTKTTVKLSDLPQGPIQADPLPAPEESDAPAYPTVVLQARRNMDKFDNCVLLTRVGGFYELYFEHAEEFAPLLNIKLASKKTNAGAIPMVRVCVPSSLPSQTN